jgi:hypothetical protein
MKKAGCLTRRAVFSAAGDGPDHRETVIPKRSILIVSHAWSSLGGELDGIMVLRLALMRAFVVILTKL